MMNPLGTVNAIMAKLPKIAEMNVVQHFRHDAEYLLRKGWNADDVLAYLMCYEDVDPNLPEDIALERMAVLRRKNSM